MAGGYREDVWYSSNGKDWTQATAAAPWGMSGSGRAGFTSVVFDNKIWVLGGYGASGFYSDVWYSSNGADWTQATPAAPAAPWGQRFAHAAVVLDGKIWVLGGEEISVGGVLRNDIWYSTDGINWIQATAPGTWSARRGHTSVSYGNKIWILGGYDGSLSNDVWWSYGPDRLYQIDITVAWRQRNGRIVGENNGEGSGGIALNGIMDGSEDADGNGMLDSPIHITGLISRRGYPAQIYMGKE